ncbi:MAG TPA: ribbon-helix-helix protein, CopG family [Actinomycetota bacterium]
MRTTLRIDDSLFAQVKELAARTRRTLTQVVEDALRETVSRGQPGGGRRASLPTFGGNGLQPGVDLDSTASLLDLMERDAGS